MITVSQFGQDDSTEEEEPGFKERLDALEQLDRITGYA